jgi:hypothetical protein
MPLIPQPQLRPFLYNENHCWQYDIRINNASGDLAEAGLTPEEAAALKVSDFTFRFIGKTDKSMCDRIVRFIRRHEWLGTMPLHPTHRFVAEYNGLLAGVVIFSMPSAFSKLLGDRTKGLERLISRGACVSWSPKNTASAMLAFAIKWMVNNTPFRLFTAYSDPEARELGTIYQSLNAIYLGQQSGTQKMYFDPDKPERGYFTDRGFRSRSAYKRYAKQLGIVWHPQWQSGETIHWDVIPEGIAQQLRAYSRAEMQRCESRQVPRKHKYALIRGVDRRETKNLMKEFSALNPKLVGLPYPKARGSEEE